MPAAKTMKGDIIPMKPRRILSCMMALLLVISLPVSALADTWYLENGDIAVNATESGQTVSQGTNVDVTDQNTGITTSVPKVTEVKVPIIQNELTDDLGMLVKDAISMPTGEGTYKFELEEVKAPKGYSLPKKEEDRYTMVTIEANKDYIADTYNSI